MTERSLYDRDFHAWAIEQAALLHAGRSERREVLSRMKVLLLTLLKWRFQPALRGNSWRLSIEEQRREVALLLGDNPSLKSRVPSLLVDAYRLALIRAEAETGLARTVFPPSCPFILDQMTDDGFWPG